MDKKYFVLYLLPPRPDFAQSMTDEERAFPAVVGVRADGLEQSSHQQYKLSGPLGRYRL